MTNEPVDSTAERTLRLVELLLAQPDGLTPQELMLQLDISRSTLFVLLRTLKNLGYLEQVERRGRYRLGARLQSWRPAASPSGQDLLSAFYQETTRQSWPETLALAVPAAEGVLILAQVEPPKLVRSAFQSGSILSNLPAAAGILAGSPAETIRSNGYALDTTDETILLALPVCRNGVYPEAALLLSAPAYRWQRQSLADALLPDLRALAARLSYRLGAPFYSPYQTDEKLPITATVALSPAEIDHFLQGPWTARLACIRPDGRPHVIPVWQEWDGKSFSILVWHGSQWADYVVEHPNISLTVDEPWPPLRRVVASGMVKPIFLEQGNPALHDLLRRLTHRYLGQTGALDSSHVQGAFRIQPDNLRGWKGMPGAAPQGN